MLNIFSGSSILLQAVQINKSSDQSSIHYPHHQLRATSGTVRKQASQILNQVLQLAEHWLKLSGLTENRDVHVGHRQQLIKHIICAKHVIIYQLQFALVAGENLKISPLNPKVYSHNTCRIQQIALASYECFATPFVFFSITISSKQ